VPERIDVDIAHLEVGDVLRLSDVPPIAEVTFLDDPYETVVATVSMPRGYAELEEAEALAAAEAEEGAEGAPAAEAAEESEPSGSESEG
jgi:hypothetical protein